MLASTHDPQAWRKEACLPRAWRLDGHVSRMPSNALGPAFPSVCLPRYSTCFLFSNVRSLFAYPGKPEHLIKTLEQLGAVACGLAEVGLRGCGQRALDNEWNLYWSGADPAGARW